LCAQPAQFSNESGVLGVVIGQYQVQVGKLALLILNSAVKLFDC
jgi:hypothetical protein